jgi:hypothetical protein
MQALKVVVRLRPAGRRIVRLRVTLHHQQDFSLGSFTPKTEQTRTFWNSCQKAKQRGRPVQGEGEPGQRKRCGEVVVVNVPPLKLKVD